MYFLGFTNDVFLIVADYLLVFVGHEVDPIGLLLHAKSLFESSHVRLYGYDLVHM